MRPRALLAFAGVLALVVGWGVPFRGKARLGPVGGEVAGHAYVVEQARHPQIPGTVTVVVVDAQYFLPDAREVARLVAWASNTIEYRAEVYDCDDYSLWFKAVLAKQWAMEGNEVPLAVAQVAGAIHMPDGKILYHAWNAIMLENGTLVMVEPQGPRVMGMSQAAFIEIYWVMF